MPVGISLVSRSIICYSALKFCSSNFCARFELNCVPMAQFSRKPETYISSFCDHLGPKLFDFCHLVNLNVVSMILHKCSISILLTRMYGIFILTESYIIRGYEKSQEIWYDGHPWGLRLSSESYHTHASLAFKLHHSHDPLAVVASWRNMPLRCDTASHPQWPNLSSSIILITRP